MKKTHKILAILLTIALSTGLLCSCGSEKKEIKSVIGNFEKACNNVDFNEMLTCIDPMISEKIGLVTGLASMFTDMGSEELLNKLSKLLTNDDTLDADSFFSTVKIKVGDITVNESIATAHVSLKYEFGENITEKNAIFDCVCKEGNWYISGFSFE